MQKYAVKTVNVFFRNVVKIISSLLGNKFNIPKKHANATTPEHYIHAG